MKRLIQNKKTRLSKVYNSCGVFISNENIKKFLKNNGYDKFLNQDEYESDLNENSKNFANSYGFFTKQKLLEDNNAIKHPMIFFVEMHQFKKIGKGEYYTAIFYFKESSNDHQNFDLSNPVKISIEDCNIGNAKRIAEHSYLGQGWTTNGRFDKLDDAIESLEKDTMERKNISNE